MVWNPRIKEVIGTLQATSVAGGSIIGELLQSEPQRHSRLVLDHCGISIDLSRHPVPLSQWDQLLDLPGQVNLGRCIDQLFAGAKINRSEDRSAQHVSMRSWVGQPAVVKQLGIQQEDHELSQSMVDYSNRLSLRLRSGQWLGATGKPVRHLVNLGIGGSHCSQEVLVAALKQEEQQPFSSTSARALADVGDGKQRSGVAPNLWIHLQTGGSIPSLHSLLNSLPAEQTLFFINSKSFTTAETLLLAEQAKKWLKDELPDGADVGLHLAGSCSDVQKAIDFGIPKEHCLKTPDSIGGRYSLWSGAGFPVQVMLGPTGWEELHQGAWAADQSFKNTPWQQNAAVLLALQDVWYQVTGASQMRALFVWDHQLQPLVRHVQQLEMESGGKSTAVPMNIDEDWQDELAGSPASGMAVWGDDGVLAQHSVFQLLHQGAFKIPVEMVKKVEDPQSSLEMAQCLAQFSSLSLGSDPSEGALSKQQQVEGNRGCTLWLLPKISPKVLGTLLATWEHRVFVQCLLYGVNAFDQWGVEQGKVLSRQMSAGDWQPNNESDRSLLQRVKRLGAKNQP